MEYKRVKDLIVLRIDRGEEIIETLKKLMEREDIRLGSITGIGATDHASIGNFDFRQETYTENTFMEPMEITSIMGNISEMEGRPYLHIHANLSNSKGKTYGGHLDMAYVSATAEIFIHLYEGQIGRKGDLELGINLLSFE